MRPVSRLTLTNPRTIYQPVGQILLDGISPRFPAGNPSGPHMPSWDPTTAPNNTYLVLFLMTRALVAEHMQAESSTPPENYHWTLVCPSSALPLTLP